MRRILRIILYRPILWITGKFSSRPEKTRIFEALAKLLTDIKLQPGKRGLVIPFNVQAGKFIIFSDQHKGTRNGADDFMQSEPNYLAALEYYAANDFKYINLGDSEELWESRVWKVIKKNKDCFEAEKKFIEGNHYIKIFGNHDLYWHMSPFASLHLKSIYNADVKVYEGLVLTTEVAGQEPESKPLSLNIYLTHGHQGDAQSDGNWLSKTFVSFIWAPLQSLLQINPNTPAYNAEKKTLHNEMMYEWSATQKNLILVTGHTHQPVFNSLTVLERLYKEYQVASLQKDESAMIVLRDNIRKREKEFTAISVDYMTMKPSYFNTGCCCFSDGDITGIEIADGSIRLIKWSIIERRSERVILEEIPLKELANRLI